MSELLMVDADIHVNEPASSWDYVDKEFRSRVRVIPMVDDPDWSEAIYDLTIDNLPIPRWVRGAREERFKGLYKLNKAKFPVGAGWEPNRYLADMDIMGLDQVVVYPTLNLCAAWIPQIDARFSAALCRGYNDWLHDFCAADRRRLKPVMALSLHSTELAIEEVRRCSEKGFVGAFIRPNPLNGRPVGHPDYHPLYRLLEELELPLGIHEGGVTYQPILGEDRTKVQWGIHAMCHAFEQMAAVVSMLEYGVFDLFPKLRTLFLEAGSSLWLAYWLNRLDEEHEHHYRVGQPMKLQPSEYFARQCFATFEASDKYVGEVVKMIGDRTLMMTGDYPHPETSYDKLVTQMKSKGLSPESLERVCRSNALAAYPRM
jgi:uncharacterized protein